MAKSFLKTLSAEFLGTMFLIIAVVGSGIMAQKLFGAQDGLSLLANSMATGCALFVLIMMFGPISGAHFNPVVSLTELLDKKIGLSQLFALSASQVVGGIIGVFISHLMFNESLISSTQVQRNGFGQLLGEFVATFGLILVIRLNQKKSLQVTALCVALYITGAYWFTSSTSFANPAVTIARSFTNSFAGIQFHDVPAFFVAQFLGGIAAYIVGKRLV